jgi:hypothetical protein
MNLFLPKVGSRGKLLWKTIVNIRIENMSKMGNAMIYRVKSSLTFTLTRKGTTIVFLQNTNIYNHVELR